MARYQGICLGFVAAVWMTAAQAAEIPMDDAGFTAFIQQRLQLYAPGKITIAGPLSLTTGTTALPSLKPVHDACLANPSNCASLTDGYVQAAARDLQKPAGTPASNVTTLYACNGTARTLEFASVYTPVGSDTWRSTGWITLDAGKCMGILQTTGDTFYARAEETNRAQLHDPNVRNGMSDSDSGIANASGDMTLCVAHVGDWDVSSPDLKGVCQGGASESAMFKTFHATGKPAIVWKLAT